jgi:hypothetical protein
MTVRRVIRYSCDDKAAVPYTKGDVTAGWEGFEVAHVAIGREVKGHSRRHVVSVALRDAF